MRLFKLASRSTKHPIANQPGRPAGRVRLTAEPLETREAPAVGKWFPPPDPDVKDADLTNAPAQLAATNLIDDQVIVSDTTVTFVDIQSTTSVDGESVALSDASSQPATAVPTETGNP